MNNLSDDALKPPAGLASIFFVVVAVLAGLAAVFSLMDSVTGNPLARAANLSAAGSSIALLSGAVFALAVLKALRQIIHELRRANARDNQV